jgi:hypothetical protein
MSRAARSIESAARHYLEDLEAMSDAQIMEPAAGKARKAVDFTYEVALINRRLAARILGTQPDPEPEGDEWWVAPENLQSKTAITEYMKSACEELVAAAKTIPDEDFERPVGAPGEEQPAFALVNFAALHTMYHDAQLNFIQELDGDLSMHWK